MRGITFCGQHSSEYNLIARSEDRALQSTLRKREVVVAGRHGVYDFGGNTYENRVISIKFTHIEKSLASLRLNARKIAAWLSQKGQLVFDDEPDKYYVARVYSNVSLTDIATTAEFTVQFECEPFAYSLYNTGTDLTWETPILWESDLSWSEKFSFQVQGNTVVKINNFGTFELKPVIQITGSLTNISFSVGSKSLAYAEAVNNNTLVIDNDKYIVKIGTVNKLPMMSGDFLILPPGINDISITGAGLNCTVSFVFNAPYL